MIRIPSPARLLLIPVALFGAACASGGGASRRAEARTGFEDAPLGALPAGWTAGENQGTGKPARWTIEKDESAPKDPHVLTVRTENIEQTFNWCVFDDLVAKDVDVAVSLKPLDGHDDQGGGLMFRFQDANNYYLTRWNPLETNVRLYHVKDGKRTTLGDADVETTPGWHRLAVTMQGTRIQVRLDDRALVEVHDSAFRDAGKVGLWTKADAVTSFDDFLVRRL
ncbi:MAG TPA: hypothetical protein VEI02_04765 [Planctomycetota bacterium]|nr:hypothetical protein [Planctomycetota bacterium]